MQAKFIDYRSTITFVQLTHAKSLGHPIRVHSSPRKVDEEGSELSHVLLFGCEAESRQSRRYLSKAVSIRPKVDLHLLSSQLCWAFVLWRTTKRSAVQSARADSISCAASSSTILRGASLMMVQLEEIEER